MGVLDGQKVNQSVTNAAFINKNQDDTMPGVLGLTNSATASGSSVTNTQRQFNSIVSFLGMALNLAKDLLPTWLTTNRGTSSDTVFQRVEALDAAFDSSTGHNHNGAGQGAPIPAAAISSVPLMGFGIQGTDLAGVTGSSTVVTSQMTGQTPSSGTSSVGVVVTAPNNKLIIRNSSNNQEYKDGSGNIVYGRLTYSSGTWTLSYYTDVSGTETAFSFGSSSGVRWYYQTLQSPLSGNAPVYSPSFFIPSDNATADVIQATTSLQGKVSLASAAQSIGSSNSAGTANASVANADHVHQGVHKFTVDSGTDTFGDINLISGANVTLSKSGQNITIAATSGGSGGGGSLRWVESTNSPTSIVEFNNQVYAFQSALAQTLYATVRVPNSYAAGSQVRLRLPFYSPDSSGTALLQTVATLIRTGTDAINSTTNQRTSTNSAVTLGAGTVNKPQAVVFDLSDSSGQINAVAISAGDTIQVALSRGTDTATSDLKALVYDSEVTFV